MPWKISIFFYLSLSCSIIGFIFPTYVSQAIGFDIGDIVFWIYGFYTIFPRDPTYEIITYLDSQKLILCYFLISITFYLVVESFVQMRNAKLANNRYSKNRIYIIAFLQLMASLMYHSGTHIEMMLSSWGFIFSAIFALIGNKELKLFYNDVAIVKKKNEIILGIVLILVPSIYSSFPFYMTLRSAIRHEISIYIVSNIFPLLILMLIIIVYGIISLIRVIRENYSK